MDKLKILEKNEDRKGKDFVQKSKNFLKGFCVPYTWGQFVRPSERTLGTVPLALQIIWNLGPGVAMMSLYGSSCDSSIACCFLRTKKL
jgi:hypothetical protein